MSLFVLLFLVLYCERKHGEGKPLADYSEHRLPEPPSWAKQGVLYELYLRAFTEEGTFRAAIEKLDHLKKLGVDIIWLMPIYPIGEEGRKGRLGSPYAVKNFRSINPELGNEEDFRLLIDEIHKRQMKVLLDIVPNHAANDHPLIDAHPEWFMQDEDGNFIRVEEDWTDVIDFTYQNPQMRRYMKENLFYWVREFDIDGYRCDVAGMVPHDFWADVIPALREIKPDLFLLAEWEDPKLLLDGFNSDYDWTLFYQLKAIRKTRVRTAEAINIVEKKDSRYPQNALPMRFLENHDEKRSLQVFGPEAIEAYATLLFSLPGLPLIYAGQEIGETQAPSLFEKDTLSWEEADSSLFGMYRELIKMRNQYSCLTSKNFTALQALMGKGSVGAFLREDDQSVAVVICNLKPNTAEKILIATPEEIKQRLGRLSLNNYKAPQEKFTLSKITFSHIFPFTTLVYVAKK